MQGLSDRGRRKGIWMQAARTDHAACPLLLEGVGLTLPSAAGPV